MSKKLIIGCCLVSALVSSGVGIIFGHYQKPVVTNLPDFSQLIEKDGPGVVHIRTLENPAAIKTGTPQEMRDMLQNHFRPSPFAPKVVDPNRGIGSGFIISADGYVLTNAHVIEGANEVIVVLTDHREFKAQVLGYDKRTDVALLKLEAEDLPTIPIGTSKTIKVGEWVFAIGSPYNLENTVTAGIISATKRDAGEYLPLIQSDVSINPGNSGGPLINIHGKVIGINSQILTQSGGSMGISFAVPIDEVIRVADQLKATGKVTRGRLGVEIADTVTRDVMVARVEEDGPAKEAGIEAGDVIIKFNGEEINGPADLPWRVGAAEINKIATVTVRRGFLLLNIKVKLGSVDENKILYSETIDVSD